MSTDKEDIIDLSESVIKQIYSETALDHGINPRNLEDLIESNAFSVVTGPCGDTMVIWLKINDETIIDTSFTTDGCAASLAAGSMVTEMAKGKSIVDALKIGQQDVLDALGGLPKESEHCALLAANTLKEAIDNYASPKT